MRLDVRSDRPVGRTAFLGSVIAISTWLLYVVLCHFVAGALTDEFAIVDTAASVTSFITDPFMGGGTNPHVLIEAVHHIPNSSRLHVKLAEFISEHAESKVDLNNAELHAMRAAQLSPYDYRPHVLLASIRDLKDDQAAAESSARAALKLAPRNPGTHYLLGSLLLLRGSFDESFEELRAAVMGNPEYLPGVLNLVWNKTDRNTEALQAITPAESKHRLALARFLLEQQRPAESAAVFRQIDPDAALQNRESGQYLNNLIASGHVSLAYRLWRGLREYPETPSNADTTIWNGGFEADIFVDFAQFDWSIEPSKYATVSIDNTIACSGKRSLRIDFLGHETTRLQDEIKQILLLRPGARYRLGYQVRTENLSAPEGPRVVITSRGSNQWVAISEPAPQESHDWQQGVLEFTPSEGTVLLAIQQRPKFSYEAPTYGTVWFDDFEIHEIR